MRRAAAIAAALLVTGLVAGCGAEGTGSKGYVDGTGVSEIKVGDRQPVTTVSGTTLDGKKVSLKQLADGKPVVVNFWAPWCGPCRAEAKDLDAAAKRLQGKAAFLGVSIRSSSKDTARAFVRTYDVTYPSLWDPDGQTLLAFPPGTASQAVPSTVVLDPQGRVSAAVHGPLPSARTLVDLVEDAS